MDYKNLFEKLLKLNQYGILLTQSDGHIYLEYETDLEMSPTDESKELIKNMADIGLSINNKHYENIEEVILKIDNLIDFFINKKVGVIS
jgi:hypothetical protein